MVQGSGVHPKPQTRFLFTAIFGVRLRIHCVHMRRAGMVNSMLALSDRAGVLRGVSACTHSWVANVVFVDAKYPKQAHTKLGNFCYGCGGGCLWTWGEGKRSKEGGVGTGGGMSAYSAYRCIAHRHIGVCGGGGRYRCIGMSA